MYSYQVLRQINDKVEELEEDLKSSKEQVKIDEINVKHLKAFAKDIMATFK